MAGKICLLSMEYPECIIYVHKLSQDYLHLPCLYKSFYSVICDTLKTQQHRYIWFYVNIISQISHISPPILDVLQNHGSHFWKFSDNYGPAWLIFRGSSQTSHHLSPFPSIRPSRFRVNNSRLPPMHKEIDRFLWAAARLCSAPSLPFPFSISNFMSDMSTWCLHLIWWRFHIVKLPKINTI